MGVRRRHVKEACDTIAATERAGALVCWQREGMVSAEVDRSAAWRRSPPPPTPARGPRPPAQVLLLAAALALAVALARAPRALAQSCDPDADATYTAAVLEYSPALGVTLENAEERFRQNVQNYVAYAKEAKRQGAEVVVFPECGLATLELPRLPDSSPAIALQLPTTGANPCTETDVHHPQELRDLSCAARDLGIYVVVNLPEVERCLPALAFCPECPGFQPRAVRSGIVACNTHGRRYFNTDVAFDRKGTIVAKYRKFNLFGEAGFVPPGEPQLAHFDADFGVRFGLFTCFDLMFEQPAVALVTEAAVTDVLFPTAWFSELPFLTAVQAQAAWAWVLDVNFLGAGYNLPEVGSTGTGLYAGRRGKVVATMEKERTNKLLVGRLPNRNACSHNATAAASLAGKIVVLARKEDEPRTAAPRPAAPPPPPLHTPPKCTNTLPATNPKIPSLYQCHLHSLLQLKEPGDEQEEEKEKEEKEKKEDKEEEAKEEKEGKEEEAKEEKEGKEEEEARDGHHPTPTVGDTVDTMRKKLEDLVGTQENEVEGEQYDYLLQSYQEDEERHKLHELSTPPLNDTLNTMGSQVDGQGDHTSARILHDAMNDELVREKRHRHVSKKKAFEKCKRMYGSDVQCDHLLKDNGTEPEGEHQHTAKDGTEASEEAGTKTQSEIKDATGKQQEQPSQTRATREAEKGPAEEPGARAGGAAGGLLGVPASSSVCHCQRQARAPARGQDVSGPAGGRSRDAGAGAGAGAAEDGYLYLKTEDLAEYVTVLLPATHPDPASFENSSLTVCHDSFCCHFQVVLSSVKGEGEAAAEAAGGRRADEPSFASGEEIEGLSFVRTARRVPVGGPLARHFIIPEGEEEDYMDEDEEDGEEDEEEEEEELASDVEEMQPTYDQYDDDEEVQMDTSAEFSMDPVLLKASGIGHYSSGQAFKETVDPEDMEPSEDAIRAQAMEDEKKAEEKLEMEGQMPGAAVSEPPLPEPHISEAAMPAINPEAIPKAIPEPPPGEPTPPPPVHREDQRYFYRVAVFNGRRTFDGITDGGLQVCAVIPCTGVTVDTCGKLHQFPSDLELTTFRYVRISGRFARVRSLPLPSTLDASLMPLPADAFSLTATVRRKETDIVMETHKSVNFLTFGIYNRNFANDPERHPSIG